jgi:hypothetical protein
MCAWAGCHAGGPPEVSSPIDSGCGADLRDAHKCATTHINCTPTHTHAHTHSNRRVDDADTQACKRCDESFQRRVAEGVVAVSEHGVDRPAASLEQLAEDRQRIACRKGSLFQSSLGTRECRMAQKLPRHFPVINLLT